MTQNTLMLVPGEAEDTSHGRYQRVSVEKAGGATYTPGVLSDFVAARMVEAMGSVPSGRRLRVLDPGVGAGELLLSLLDALAVRGIREVDVHAFETDAAALEISRQRLAARFPDAVLHMVSGSFLDYALVQAGNGQSSAYFDLIIANPPYIRTQVLGAAQARWLASQFGLKGRVDMYHAFVAGIARVLHQGGIAGLIVSNRFMSTRSGAAVRALLCDHFRIRHLWDLGDTRLFDTAVLPAVLLLERGAPDTRARETGFVSAYETEPPLLPLKARQVPDAVAALVFDDIVALPDGRHLRVTHGRLDAGVRSQDIWRMATGSGDDWLRTVAAHTWKTFGNLGKIRVGVKTCADKVFIRQDWHERQGGVPELLRPLMTHHMARRFRAQPTARPRHILYPHDVRDGRRVALDLADYPLSAAYLAQHRTTLEARSYVIEGGREWYEIWVPHDPARWTLPKLVFRDIAEKPTFWVDLEGSVVNGDCYWLAAESKETVELLWLAAAVANSSFIERFYDENFQNKLYAGRRRYVTQYVERFPLPNPALPLSRQIAATARRIHEVVGTPEAEALQLQLDGQIWQVFGVAAKEAGR